MTLVKTAKKPCGHTIRVYDRADLNFNRKYCKQCVNERNQRLLADPKIQRYIQVIKLKPKSNGKLSPKTWSNISVAIPTFCKHLGLNGPTELLAYREAQEEQLCYKLEEFGALGYKQRGYSQWVRGFLRANRRPITVYIDYHSIDTRPPPSEERLQHIYENATLRQKALMALQADTGERVMAVALTTTSELPDLYQNMEQHEIVFSRDRTKTKTGHASYYSGSTARMLILYLKHAPLESNKPLFPKYHSDWKKITDYSKTIGTYLRSQHLRKRFVSLAERTGIPTTTINYFMGDNKGNTLKFSVNNRLQSLHCAEHYSLSTQEQYSEDYRQYLLKILPLGNENQIHATQSTANPSSHTSQDETMSILRDSLQRANNTIDSLNETIRILSKQVSKIV